MAGLSYNQRKEVKEIIDNRLNNREFSDILGKFIDKLSLDLVIKNRAQSIVPDICREWTKENMKRHTETYAEGYMKDNFQRVINQEITGNAVQGFVAKHLDQVEKKVTETTNTTIKKIVNTNAELNPIFTSILSTLAHKNHNQLEEQSWEVKKQIVKFNDLEKRFESLENRHSNLVNFIIASVVCGTGFAVYKMYGSKL